MNNNNTQNGNFKPEIPKKIFADEVFFNKISQNYVEEAENVIRNLKENGSLLTTSSIRNILELINTVREKLVFEGEKIKTTTNYDIQYILLKLYYIYGRASEKKDKKITSFIEKSKMRELVLCVGDSKTKFEIFAKYVEALVAFHKYYGGKDN